MTFSLLTLGLSKNNKNFHFLSKTVFSSSCTGRSIPLYSVYAKQIPSQDLS